MPKFNIKEDVIYTNATNGKMYEATIVMVKDDGTYEIYEWDRGISHPAKEEDLTQWEEGVVMH